MPPASPAHDPEAPAEKGLGPLHGVSHHADQPDPGAAAAGRGDDPPVTGPGHVQLDLDLGDVLTYPVQDQWTRLDWANQLGEWDTRAAKCHRTRRRALAPTPMYRTERGGWSIGGVVRCNHWTCPACGVARARDTSAVLGLCIERWLAGGLGLLAPDVWMLTLTMPHTRDDHPGAIVDALFAAWEVFTRSRAWRTWRARWGVSSVVRVMDVTFGGRNGCHPHFHVALFPSLAATCWRDADAGELVTQPIRGMVDGDRRDVLDGLAVELRSLWHDALRTVGVTRAIARESLELTGGERAAAYFVGWGLGDEVGATTIKARSHLRLLDAAEAGHQQAGPAYAEFCTVAAGRQWVSSGLGDLRRRCGVEDADVDAYRQRKQAERDAAAAARGEPVVLVRPLLVEIPADLYGEAMRQGWRRLVRCCDAADAAGLPPQLALRTLLLDAALARRGHRWAGPDYGADPPRPG